MKKHTTSIYDCRCVECREQPTGRLARLHESINWVVAELNEKNRRRFVGLLALQRGHGGVQQMSTITGLSRVTIRRGREEIAAGEIFSSQRVRVAGGGRQQVEKKGRRC